MIGHDRVEKAVNSGVGGSGGRHRIGDIEAVSTHCSAHAALNVCCDITLGAEAKKVVEEGIVTDADLADAGLIFGTGFAPFRGGPLHYLAGR